MADDGRRRMEDGGQRADDGGWRADDGGRMTEDGGQRAEGGRRKMESGGWKRERKVKRRKSVGCNPWEFNGERWVSPNDGARKQIQSYRDLDVFNLAYTLAMEVFRLTARFPKEERYALVDQMRRSSRSVCANIVEGFAKRRYEAVFKNSLNDSLGESEETKLWADFALDCDYIQADEHEMLTTGYKQVGAMLWTLMTRWETFS